MNESHGTLIATQLNRNHAALFTLQSTTRSLSTYGPDGHTELLTWQRELGWA